MTGTRGGSDRPAGLSPKLLSLIGNVLLVAALDLAARDFRYVAHGVTATGTVQDRIVVRGEAGNEHAVFVEFRDASGSARIARIEVLKSLYDDLVPAATREVVYLPGAPERARFAGDTSLGVAALMLALAALFHFVGRFAASRAPERDESGPAA